ncbi:AAA family ATPase [Shewanella xiamenensis]|uniref:AAA family ATPase n=1 Tax=Shewanella xiamenensis TaxID=332186 RepID=UPI00313B2ECB
MELISECFAFLERAQRPDFQVKTPLGFGFTIEYQIHNHSQYAGSNYQMAGSTQTFAGAIPDPIYRVELAGNSKEPEVYLQEGADWYPIELDNLQLPRVVGYSSGLNENLQRSFLKNANQIYEGLTVFSRRKRQLRRESEPQIVDERFLRRYPYLFRQEVTRYQSGNEFIEQFGSISEVSLRSSTHVYLDYDSAQLAIASLSILNHQVISNALCGTTFNRPVEMQMEYDLKNWVIDDDIAEDIAKFIGDMLPWNVDGRGGIATSAEFEEFGVHYLRGFATLDFLDTDVTKFLAQSNADSGLRMFEKLYRIQQLGLKALSSNARQNLKKDNYLGAVKKPLKSRLPFAVLQLKLADEDGRVVNYDDLSDGEAQLLQVLAIITLFKDEQTLFLLDEPETHLNPAWRTHFHSFLQQALSAGTGNAQVLVSTHSPFMISSLHKDSVFMFERNADGTIRYHLAIEETYGASFDVLIKQFFGLESLISHTVVEEIRRRIRVDENGIVEWLETLGKSPEKSYLIKKLGS